MKRFILTLVIACMTILGKAQICVGLDESEIYATFSDASKYKVTTGKEGTLPYIKVVLTDPENYYTRYYYMGLQSKRCYLYLLVPLNRDALKTFAEYCNDKFIADDDDTEKRTWITYFRDMTLSVNLKFSNAFKINCFFFQQKR